MSHPDLAQLLSQLIREKGIYQADIARCLGLDKSAISKWLNDAVTPDRENLVNLRNCGFTTAEVNRLLDAAGHKTLSPQETEPLPASNDLDEYLRHVRQRHASLDFSVFQEGHEREFSTVSLDTVYIPLRLAGRPPDEAPGKLDKRHDPAGESYVLSNRLLAPDPRLGQHLALLGDAGSGKTTILRQLTSVLAQAWLAQDLAYARERTGLEGELWLPLFVPLRYYHHYCGAEPGRAIGQGSFFDFLSFHFRQEYGLALPSAFFQTLLSSSRCLLALDGFDEVPDELSRRRVVELAHDLAADAKLGRNRLILSSRVAAYGGSTHLGGNFQTMWVQSLNPAERADQVRRWVAGIPPQIRPDLKADDILRPILPDSPLDQLAVTPMIVTALCVVYFYDHKLPEQRAQLYRRCVDIMLGEKLKFDEPGQSLADLGGKPDFKRQLLARLAFEMHWAKKDGVDKEQAGQWLKEGFKSVAEAERENQAKTFLDTITRRGTLLQERAGLFSFGRQHQTFREFLAGYHLILGLRPKEREPRWPQLIRADWWREPIRLAAGATVFENRLTCEDFLHELLELANQPEADPATRLAGYKLAAESLWDLGQHGRDLLDIKLQTEIVKGLAQHLFDDPAIADPQAGLLKDRVAAAEALGFLGDPREGVITLPPLLTDPIEGEFRYGDAKRKERRRVAPFQAGVYPITNAQFKLFWQTGGYGDENLWGPEGVEWRRGKPRYDWQKTDQPDFWDDERFNQPNQPVVGVTWYEAKAFCNWLTATYGREYRLPTEEEWERLARGQEGWEYPWGDGWTEGLANTSEANLGQTTAVGLFPSGASPAGVYDCAGNVWEWCADWYDREHTFRALRGGSWDDVRGDARCAFRYWDSPYVSGSGVGFRVVSPHFVVGILDAEMLKF